MSTDVIWTTPLRQALVKIKVRHLKHLFVSTYDTRDPDSPAGNKHGYQRNPDAGRFKKIGRYYLENPHLVPPILVAVRLKFDSDIKNAVELLLQGNFQQLKEKYGKQCFSILDGQHRTGGLLDAAASDANFGDREVPVAMMFGLDYATETEVFNIVNSTQKKLPKALIEVNRGDISEKDEMSHSQRIRTIAFGIARDKDSVWFDQINMTGGRAPGQKVTYEGLRRSTANMFPAKLINQLDEAGIDPLQDCAKPYWTKIRDLFPQAWQGQTRTVIDPNTAEEKEVSIPFRLKELVGVASLARLGQDLVSMALLAQNDFNVPFEQALLNKMDLLGHVDWEKSKSNKWMGSQAGFAGQADLYELLHKLVFAKLDPDGNKVDG